MNSLWSALQRNWRWGSGPAWRDDRVTVAQRRAAQALTWVFRLSALTALFLWLFRRVLIHAREASAVQDFFFAINIPVTFSPVSVIVLTAVAIGLARKKRIAWLVVWWFQILGAAGSVLSLIFFFGNPEDPDSSEELSQTIMEMIPPLLVFLVLAVPLWRLRKAFPARTRPGSWVLALVTLLAGLTLSVVLAQLLLWFWPGSEGKVWQQVATVLLNALGLPHPDGWAVHVGRLIPQATGVVMAVTVLAAILLFFRPRKAQDSWESGKEVQLRQLLAGASGSDSLAYFATRRDKYWHFSPDGRAAIAYRLVNGVALASGDPIGDPQSWPEAISSWEAQARWFGWLPAVLACSEEGARAYSRVCHLDVLRLGDEAVLTQERFALTTPALTEVRKTAKRLRRAGVSVQIARVSELTADELARLRQVAEDWRVGRVERGFSMALGRFGDPADTEMVVARVFDASGELVAFQSFVPWGTRGLSLDLMRRSPSAPNGTTELLVTELMAWGADHGIHQVSLNFAFFRHIFAEAEQVAAPRLAKANSRVLGLLDRFWQLQRLYRSNAKYHPEWVPRYWALPSPLAIVRVGVAAAMAEGFLPFSRVADQSLGLSADELEILKEQGRLEPPPVAEPSTDQGRERLRHLEVLRESGQDGFPVGSRTAIWLRDLVAAAEPSRPEVAVVGRVRTIRHHGGVCFADLVDGGQQLQLLLDRSELGPEAIRSFARLVDSGDLVEVRGALGASRRGTKSLLVLDWTMLAKALRPVPWWGLTESQARIRDRSLDLLVHPDQLELLRSRSRVISAVRHTLLADGFLEVETPILGLTNGGATARPFRTHINAYGMDLVLRIAPELALKRLLVAGMDSIFEIGRNFRNEGADATHNPEFTVVEAYRALADYSEMRLLTQKLVQAAATAVYGRPVLPLDLGNGPELVDISGDWPVITVCDAVSQATGKQVSVTMPIADFIEIATEHGVFLDDSQDLGHLIEALFDELVANQTMKPTFFTDYPATTSPLTAPHRKEIGLAERWDLIVGGMELGTAYSELTDPLIQRQRLMEQSWRAAAGDPEAMEVDEEFLKALELGMPPTGGLGIGLDRLVMVITGTTIRQILAFPFVRPQE